jgi:hypothetical protein
MPNLEEQPLQRLYLFVGSCRIEVAALLRQMPKDSSGFEYSSARCAVHDDGDLCIRA